MQRKSPVKKTPQDKKTKKRDDVIEFARTWIGTPFLHQGRLIDVGVDCAGLVIGIANEFKLAKTFKDKKNYSRNPTGTMMAEVLGEHLERINASEAIYGDILHFKFARFPQHVGILTDNETFIHADSHEGKVVETRLSGHWAREVRGAYRFKELKD